MVVFPSVTICNLNQIQASYLHSLDVYGNPKKTNFLIKEYMDGYHGDLSENEKIISSEFKQKISTNESFLDLARQPCRHLFIHMQFQGKELDWSELPANENELGPFKYPTDFGSCCYFSPHLSMDPFQVLDNPNKVKELETNAKHGQINGLDILLNAENFNYAYRYSLYFIIIIYI